MVYKMVSNRFIIILIKIFAISIQLQVPLVFCAAILAPGSNYIGHNGPCNSTALCDPHNLLICTAGVCQCESPSNQRYDRILHKCLSAVGGPCTMIPPGNASSTQLSTLTVTSSSRLCIENAQCVEITEGNYTECQCIENYIENADGQCVPGMGQPCNYGVDECNPLGMIVCKNKRCGCLHSLQVYDKEMKRCVSPAGTHCKYDSLQLGCVKNALCYPFYYWIPPKCICKPGYEQTKNRTCVMTDSYRDNGEI